MTAIVVPELELIELEHLDEQWALPCQLRRPYGCGGDSAAEWILYGADCCPLPKVALYCTPCKDVMLGVDGICCENCNCYFTPAPTAFKLIEPLN